jgi:hypothetical protein
MINIKYKGMKMTKYRTIKMNGFTFESVSIKKEIECNIRIPFYAKLESMYPLTPKMVMREIRPPKASGFSIEGFVECNYKGWVDIANFESNRSRIYMDIVLRRIRSSGLYLTLSPHFHCPYCVFTGYFNEVVDKAMDNSHWLHKRIHERYLSVSRLDPDAPEFYPDGLKSFLLNMTPENSLSFLLENILGSCEVISVEEIVESIINEFDIDDIMAGVIDYKAVARSLIENFT